MEKDTEYSPVSNWRYVFHEMCCYDRKYPLYMSVKGLASFLGPLVAAVIPSVAIALVQQRVELPVFIAAMFGMVALTLCFGIVSTLMDHQIKKKNYEVAYDPVQKKTVAKILSMDYAHLESARGKKLADSAKYSYEVDWQGWNRIMDMFTPFAYNLLGIVVYAILLAPKCPWVLPIFAIMTVMNILLERKVSIRSYQKHRDVIWETDSRVNYFFQRSTSATDGKDIRMYRMENWFTDVMQALVKKRMMVWKYVEVGYFLPNLSDTIWSLIRDIVAYSVLVHSFLAGELDAASFTLYLGIITGFAGWLNGGNLGDGFVRAYSELLRCNWSIHNFRNFMDLPADHSPRHAVPFEQQSAGAEIEFRNVCFRYPETEKDILHDFNMTIRPGEKIALVGVNGAGKTTLVKLLCGFYQPTAGQILVNGVDISKYDPEEYRNYVGAVFQDMMIMATSVAENVACQKKEEIDFDRLWECLRLADIDRKILSLPKKENTSVTNFLDKEGVLFSGGEIQRLLLARALYKNAPILLLDEPTSALDPLAETAIYEQYHKLAKDKTTIFISHRLASTRFCNRILFFADGCIRENGTHEELMERNGAYAEMFAIQSQYYEKEGQESS